MLRVAKHVLARLAYSSLSNLSLASFQAEEYIILLPHHMHPTHSNYFKISWQLLDMWLKGLKGCNLTLLNSLFYLGIAGLICGKGFKCWSVVSGRFISETTWVRGVDPKRYCNLYTNRREIRGHLNLYNTMLGWISP